MGKPVLCQRTFSSFWLMTNLTHSFSMYLFHASTCFEQQVIIIRRIKLCQYIIWYNTLVAECLACRHAKTLSSHIPQR
jgi:hypothetical protein